MFKPHVTVACIVHAEDKFLVVEETINGKSLWNQPAGHRRQMKRWRRPPRVNCGRDWHHGATTVFYPYASVDCAG